MSPVDSSLAWDLELSAAADHNISRELGRVVRKPISANPGLKVNREFNFFYIKVF